MRLLLHAAALIIGSPIQRYKRYGCLESSPGRQADEVLMPLPRFYAGAGLQLLANSVLQTRSTLGTKHNIKINMVYGNSFQLSLGQSNLSTVVNHGVLAEGHTAESRVAAKTKEAEL